MFHLPWAPNWFRFENQNEMFKLNKNVAVNEAWSGEKLTLPFERTNQTVNAILAAWATTHLHRRWRPRSVHLQFQLDWTNHSHMHNTGHTKSLSVVREAFWKCRDVPLWMCNCVSTSEEIQETGIRDWVLVQALTRVDQIQKKHLPARRKVFLLVPYQKTLANYAAPHFSVIYSIKAHWLLDSYILFFFTWQSWLGAAWLGTNWTDYETWPSIMKKCELAFTTWTYVNLLDHVDTRRCDLGQRWATFLNRGTSSWVGIDPGSCLVRAVFYLTQMAWHLHQTKLKPDVRKLKPAP